MLAYEHGNFSHRSTHHIDDFRKLSSKSSSHHSEPHHQGSTTKSAEEHSPAAVAQAYATPSSPVDAQQYPLYEPKSSSLSGGAAHHQGSIASTGAWPTHEASPVQESAALSSGGSSPIQNSDDAAKAVSSRSIGQSEAAVLASAMATKNSTEYYNVPPQGIPETAPARLSGHLEPSGTLQSRDLGCTISNSSIPMYKPSTSSTTQQQSQQEPAVASQSSAQAVPSLEGHNILCTSDGAPLHIIGTPTTTSFTTSEKALAPTTVTTNSTVVYQTAMPVPSAQPETDLARLVARASSSSQSLYKPSVTPTTPTSASLPSAASTRAPTPTTTVTNTSESLVSTPGPMPTPASTQSASHRETAPVQPVCTTQSTTTVHQQIQSPRTVQQQQHYGGVVRQQQHQYGSTVVSTRTTETTTGGLYRPVSNATTTIASQESTSATTPLAAGKVYTGTAQESSSTGYYTMSRIEHGQERIIGYNTIVQEDRIISERIVEHEVKVPKKVVREEVIEKIYIVPETIIREEIIEEIQKIQETIIEVAKPVIQEKIVEVPEIEYRDKIVEKIEKVAQEKIVEVPKIEYQERTVEVPKITYQERIVEVPEVEIKDVITEKIVEVPHIVDDVVIKEVPVPQYVDRTLPDYVDVEVFTDTERVLPTPVEAVTTFEYQLAQFRPRVNKVQYPLYVPRFVEVPVSAELLDANTVVELEADASKLQILTGPRAPGLCDVEGLALDFVKKDVGSLAAELSPADLQAALTNAWKTGQLRNARSAAAMLPSQQQQITSRSFAQSTVATPTVSVTPYTTQVQSTTTQIVSREGPATYTTTASLPSTQLPPTAMTAHTLVAGVGDVSFAPRAESHLLATSEVKPRDVSAHSASQTVTEPQRPTVMSDAARPAAMVETRPTITSDVRQAAISDYAARPAVTSDYAARPAVTSDYAARPAVTSDYAARPAVTSDYAARPAVTSDYAARPATSVARPAVTSDYTAARPVATSNLIGTSAEATRPSAVSDYTARPATASEVRPAAVSDYAPRTTVLTNDFAARPTITSNYAPQAAVQA